MKIDFEYVWGKRPPFCSAKDVEKVVGALCCSLTTKYSHSVQDSVNGSFHVEIEMDELTENNKKQVKEIIEKYLNITFFCNTMNFMYMFHLKTISFPYFYDQVGGEMVGQVVNDLGLRDLLDMDNEFKNAFMCSPHFLIAEGIKKSFEVELKKILNIGLEKTLVQEQVVVADEDENPDKKKHCFGSLSPR